MMPNISFSLGENCSSPLLALGRASTQLDWQGLGDPFLNRVLISTGLYLAPLSTVPHLWDTRHRPEHSHPRKRRRLLFLVKIVPKFLIS